MIALLKIIVILLNSLDYLTTEIAIKKYGKREGNPIVRPLLKKPVLWFFIKMILVNSFIFFVHHTVLTTWIIVIIMFGLVVIHNSVVIIREKKKRILK